MLQSADARSAEFVSSIALSGAESVPLHSGPRSELTARFYRSANLSAAAAILVIEISSAWAMP